MEVKLKGCIEKMRAELSSDGKVSYFFRLSAGELPMADLLGKSIQLEFSGQIACIHCGAGTNKSFSQGYCFTCFNQLAQCDRCIMSPELCHFHAGTCREPDWAQTFCMTDHLVYLANASGVKVGITRINQIPTRWIDQGAIEAVPLYRVATRQLSGLVEAAAKTHVADKTNWRLMLKNAQPDTCLKTAAADLQAKLMPAVQTLQSQYGLQAVQAVRNPDSVSLSYPVLQYPDKVSTLNPEKTPLVSGRLEGIRGQYLLLDSGVINIRKFSGYELALSVGA
ncbi:DUF2797 domain-containing protein [Simiduia agarivorans]|uniref:DUF2797 domain-containing protein n=1 Tax=Simiduia agarivorans (strain DSM 21679 / JCM 13881 / BCRC 17597 / SA1) TaxID=1117647 RepID=K4KTW6_SIMAS|nr:DUF2797 domain-containing protein [Simiduia agarivorans]AFU97427.1 hypothetical protein M5M_00970 [Simiduia agarivorans SA1 = DSM 21679]